jgi:hypothetical protein
LTIFDKNHKIVTKRNYLSVSGFYIILILRGEKTMKNSKNWFGILVLALVFTLTAIGCEEDPPEETTKVKTLAITMPRDIFKESFLVGLFSVGTSLEDAIMQKGVVAGAISGITPGCFYTDTDPTTLTVSLYTMANYKWTGNGTYDVYAGFSDDSEQHLYKVDSVSFSSASTKISISNSNEVSWE